MALIERIMALEEPRIPVHYFFAANQEAIEGNVTVAQVKAAFAMDSAAATEYDSIVALAPSGGSALAVAQKSLYVSRVHAVFMLAEGRFTGYDTPAAVRTKLGI